MLPQIKRILYATDLSPDSSYVLRYAVNSTKMHGAKMVILHVMEVLPPSYKALVEPYLDHDMLRRVSDEKNFYARNAIEKSIQKVQEKEVKQDFNIHEIVDTIELAEGFPADVILKKADELNCDAIIMGMHGKGFLKHSYFGSNCKRVLRRARKPVFIIPLPENESEANFDDE